jgi:sec-independent protein translocase protein TatC
MTAPRISPKVSDDLFDSSSMTFGEHLEHLRKALAKASAWVGIGLIFGLFLADDIVQYIQTPLKAALEEFALKQDLKRLQDASGVQVSESLAEKLHDKGIISEDVLIDPRDFQLDSVLGGAKPIPPAAEPPEALKPEALKPEDQKPEAQNKASQNQETQKPETPKASEPPTTSESAKGETAIPDAAKTDTAKTGTQTEVKAEPKKPDPNALYKGIADDEIVERLIPVRIWRKVSTRVETLNIQEGFMIWLKAALIAGIVFGSPGIFWHIWGFVAAGLYPHERKYVYVFLPMSLGLFFAGVSLAFFVIFRFVIEFLLEANASLGTDLSPRLNEYVSFALILPLGFGLAFQLPLVMVFLNRIGMFSVQNYLQQWKIAILVIAFLSMILTPGGDIYSMCGMGLPLIFLYFTGIALCKYLPMGRPMGADGYDPVA